MKVVNTVKLKEEFDYESLCRKLETQVDHLSAEVERQQKLRENDKNQMKKLLEEFENSSAKAEKSFAVSSEVFISVMLLNFTSHCLSLLYTCSSLFFIKWVDIGRIFN